MTNKILEKILLMQTLTLDAKDKAKLAKAKIALAGLGGIGCPLLELLIRNGIQNIRIADLDKYDSSNARQSFMNQNTIGRRKVEIAKKRMLEINPKAQITVYKNGVTPINFFGFCKGVDIICNETDALTVSIALNYAGDYLKIPVIHASRAKWPDRHLLTVGIYDYRKNNIHFKLDSSSMNTKWGVDKRLLERYLDHLKNRQDDIVLREEIEKQNKKFRKEGLLKLLKSKDISAVSIKSRKYLLSITKKYPSNFYKMVISPEECFTMAAMATAIIKNIILGISYQSIAVDLSKGKAIAPFVKRSL